MNAKTLSALCAGNDGAQRCKYEHYAGHSAFSAPGRHSALLDILPSDPAGVARTAQALLIYEHAAEPFYGYKVPEARRGESHIRPMEKMLDALLVLDDRPLSVARLPEKRLVGICRHYMLLSVAILRQHGIPARGRGASPPTSIRASSRIIGYVSTGKRLMGAGPCWTASSTRFSSASSELVSTSMTCRVPNS